MGTIGNFHNVAKCIQFYGEIQLTKCSIYKLMTVCNSTYDIGISQQLHNNDTNGTSH